MPSYPNIQHGLGKLTPALWDRLMVMLKAYEDGKGFGGVLGAQPGLKRPYFLAKITDSAAIVGEDNRYKYEFTEVVLDSSYGFAARSGGREGTDALNLCEMSNTDTHVGAGVDLEGAAYPAGFSMMPIGECGDGEKIDVLVVMFAVRDETGALRSVFSLANDHDGTCT